MRDRKLNSLRSAVLNAAKPIGILVSATIVIASGFLALWHTFFQAPLDLWWIWDSKDEALQTMVRFTGDLSTFYLLGLVLWLSFCRLFWILSSRALALLITVTIVGQLSMLCLGYVVSPLTEVIRLFRSDALRTRAEVLLMALMRDQPNNMENAEPSTYSRDSVLVIQLESANGLILQVPQDDKYAEQLRLQHLATLDRWSSRGMILNRLWETAVQTHRAYESFYCGIARNIGGSFSFKSTMPQPCVPRILLKHGYRTIFVNNYHDPEFQNFSEFARAMGFESYLDSSMLLEKRATNVWGEDECVFAESLLRYFREHLDHYSKYFLNVKFSPNHAPFCRPGLDCSRLSLEVRYLHSSLRQLQCAELLEQKMRALFAEREKSLHVIVLSDTSWPLGLSDFSSKFNERGISTDGFLSYGAILPATTLPIKIDSSKNPSLSTLSQLDLGPTILELTGIPNANIDNSLLPLLRDGSLSPNYEHCHMLSQPFGDIEFGVLKPGELSVYNLGKNRRQVRFLSDGIFESRDRVSVSAEIPADINSASFCRRFIKTQISDTP